MPIPFVNEDLTFTQPDGREIQVKGWGNQYQAAFESLDGYTLVINSQNGFLEYVTYDGRELYPVNDEHPNKFRGEKNVRNFSEILNSRIFSIGDLEKDKTRWSQRIEEARSSRSFINSAAANSNGKPVGLCILIDFPDVKTNITQEMVERFCNLKGYKEFGNNGSVRDYFFDNSNGKMDYTNLVSSFYTAKKTRSYYTDENIRYPIRSIELITEALNAVKLKGEINFDDLSSDDSGNVYALNIFYAGNVVNKWSKGLWPHSHFFPKTFRLKAGRFIHDYQITNIGDELTLGTFCHENGHLICDFPDLYDTDFDSNGIGQYCLMGYGGTFDKKNPSNVCAYLKYLAGWTNNEITFEGGTKSIELSSQNDFFILKKNDTEYMIIEYRTTLDRDKNLPEDGLAVFHVDRLGNNKNQQMTQQLHYECSLIQADNRNDLENRVNYGGEGDFFTDPNRNYGSNTISFFKWWSGSSVEIEISKITLLQGKVNFEISDSINSFVFKSL